MPSLSISAMVNPLTWYSASSEVSRRPEPVPPLTQLHVTFKVFKPTISLTRSTMVWKLLSLSFLSVSIPLKIFSSTWTTCSCKWAISQQPAKTWTRWNSSPLVPPRPAVWWISSTQLPMAQSPSLKLESLVGATLISIVLSQSSSSVFMTALPNRPPCSVKTWAITSEWSSQRCSTSELTIPFISPKSLSTLENIGCKYTPNLAALKTYALITAFKLLSI